MRRLALSILLLALAGAASSAEEPRIRFSDTLLVVGDPVWLVPVPPGKAVEVAFRVGELDIDARPVSAARLEVRADCREMTREVCARRIERLRLESRELDDRVRVRLTGLSRREMKKLGIVGTIVVPSRAPLIVRMGIGDLDIAAGPEDLDVGMSIGDLTVRAPRHEVGSVGIRTRIGDASLAGPGLGDGGGDRRALIGARVAWSEGEGDSRIDVRLGIGDAKVRLQ